MNLEYYRKTYEEFSGVLSKLVRNLSFMGFGIVWILIGGLDGFKKGIIPQQLLWVLVLLVGYLILDVAHYLYQTIIWYIHFKKLEKDKGATYEENDLTAPKLYANCAWGIFWFKIAIMVAAYVVLLIYIVKLIM